MLRILSELTAVVWAMAHKKALPGQGFMASVSESGGGCALPDLQDRQVCLAAKTWFSCSTPGVR
ncbi:hypothetical protein KKZ38_17180 [Enterobacter hormaechei subsp. xiangfangensis]|nr:hypothetical protein [Enterobacter hormaechei subsp. xiangfangensis]